MIASAVKWRLEEVGATSLLEAYGTSLGLATFALGAHLTWTLLFGPLIMVAVFNRFNPAYEKAARDLGASPWQAYEIARTSQASGDVNTLPLELRGLTTTSTSPATCALGTATTPVSLLVVALTLVGVALLRRLRRTWQPVACSPE